MSGVAARLGWGQREAAANGTDTASSSTLEAANEAAQQQERRATLAEAELREARHALRELALNLPVCERLVADLRADSAPSSPSVVVGAGAVGAALSGPREAELTQELEHVRLLLEHTRAELTSAQKASEYLAAKGGGGGREVAQLREQLEEAREEGAMAKVQVARALTLAGRSPRSSTEHAMGGGDAQRGARGVDMLTSLEASEGHVREGRELVSQLEARLDAQAERVQEQDARLLAYARAQDARDGEVRAREAALARQQEQHRAQLGEWRTLVARREAALQERQAALLHGDAEEGDPKAAALRRSQRLNDSQAELLRCQEELVTCREEAARQREQKVTWELEAEARGTEVRRLQELLCEALEADEDGLVKGVEQTGGQVRRAKAAGGPTTEALLEQLEEQQNLISQLQALPTTEAGGRGSDSLQQRRRENLRRREAERVVRLAKGAARAEELEQQLLRQATKATELHKLLAEQLARAALPPAAAEHSVFPATATLGGLDGTPAPRRTPHTPVSYRHKSTAELRELLEARGVALPPSPLSRQDVEMLCAEHGIAPGKRLFEDDSSGAGRPPSPRSTEVTAAETEALAARWRDSRATLVNIACVLREEGLMHVAFRAWLGRVWERRLRSQAEHDSEQLQLQLQQQQGPDALLILTSLEDQRRRLMRMLHLAHLENRWHRQYLSRTVHHKLLLLLWCGGPKRTLQRCWMAWGVHMMHVRMAREQRQELHQLAYALRVAAFAQKPLLQLDGRDAQGDVAQREADIFDGYCQRRAWLGWSHVVAQARIERHYAALNRKCVRVLQSAEPAVPVTPTPTSAQAAPGKRGESLFGPSLFGSFRNLFGQPDPGDEPEREEDRAVGRELLRLRTERLLSGAWLTWRVQTSHTRLRALEDADKCHLITALWKAATSGIMDSQVSVGKVMKGRAFFGLESDGDDDDDDDDGTN